MAIVKTGITRNGVRYAMCDKCYANITPEEHERRRQRACRAAYECLVQGVKERAMAAAEAEKGKKA